ncbi:cyanophycin synthetase [Dendrosporobacter sp. 1207_IL3150]|uniref:cyanophycin synthetase n=1 Tax=Dendrosporobacter sp. 1207_IL3150 TaxID=3084054 RepID=UPI002FDB03EF
MMRILQIRTLQGPNIYSYKPVLWLKLALGQYDNIASCAVVGFIQRLLALLPGLQEHKCSRNKIGGFVERLNEGTYLAHIFEHVMLEVQNMAGYDVNFGKARSTHQAGIYDVIVGFKCPAAARQSAYVTQELLKAALEDLPFDVGQAIKSVKSAGEKYQLGPSTNSIYQAAIERDIPVRRFADENLLVLGHGRFSKRIWATITDKTSALATDLVSDKYLTGRLLEDNGIPVPQNRVVNDVDQALEALNEIGGRVVVKPLSGNHGNGVTIDIKTQAEVERAFQIAREYDESVLVEEYIPGRQYRICIVNGRMVAAAERIPAYVVGDGQHTVAELVNLVNSNPDRGDGHEKPLTKIMLDAVAITVLAKQNLTPQAVPALKQIVRIRDCANLSAGGTAVDVTGIVHPENIKLTERAARLVGLDVAGIDLVAEDITVPVKYGNGAIIEINAAPGIRMHHYPTAGKPRDVAGHIVEYLFSEKTNGRIPITAITGTNGKTTVTRMISHIWQQAGYNVGMTTTDGIYINGQCILNGDTTGPDSARIILSDPNVDVAVLETARGGIVRGGLAFDKCNIGIVTNITEDHLGQDGIESLEDLAYIKSLVLEIVQPDGIALINADDPYASTLAARVQSEIMYFSIEPNNIVIRRHLGAGGKAVFVKEGTVHIACGGLARPIIAVKDIPATLDGIALHNLQNAVIAVGACYSAKVPVSYIRKGLSTFDQNPGRMTMLTVGSFRVCVDYGHNPAGYQALLNTARRMGAKRLIGVIAAPGDRRDDVTINIGRIAGKGFDYLYIKEDDDLRGRSPGETAELLRRGAVEAGFAEERISVIMPEAEAVGRALEDAEPGDLVIIFYERYDAVMNIIQNFAEQLTVEQGLEHSSLKMEQVVVAGVQNV